MTKLYIHRFVGEYEGNPLSVYATLKNPKAPMGESTNTMPRSDFVEFLYYFIQRLESPEELRTTQVEPVFSISDLPANPHYERFERVALSRSEQDLTDKVIMLHNKLAAVRMFL